MYASNNYIDVKKTELLIFEIGLRIQKIKTYRCMYFFKVTMLTNKLWEATFYLKY